MASIGHIAVGLAAARVYTGRMTPERPSGHAMLFWSALSMLPDADVVGFSLGVGYADEWGHRGATHSLVFAAAAGIVTGLLAPRFRAPALRTFIAATLVVASHGLLDTLTDGGLGCALFWPFDETRYFAPWRPIPVAPIGLGYLSARGVSVALTELIIFAPLIWFGSVSRRGSERDVGGRLQ
jgi:inner membrane protein